MTHFTFLRKYKEISFSDKYEKIFVWNIVLLVIRENQFNLLVYEHEQPYFSKNKKILQHFGSIAFTKKFILFLIYYFLFLDKLIINKAKSNH